MDDERIIGLLEKQDSSALKEVQLKYGRLLYKLAYGVLCSETEAREVVNDTLLALWKAFPDNPPVHLSAYICKTARNLALNKYRYLRAEKRNSEYTLSLEEIGDVFSSSSSPENEIIFKETEAAVLSFINTLDDRTRRIFLRRYWYFDSIKDIAAAFSITENNVRGILFRAREKLRDHLIKEGIGIE